MRETAKSPYGYGLAAFLWNTQHTARTPAMSPCWVSDRPGRSTGLLVVWRWVCGGAD